MDSGGFEEMLFGFPSSQDSLDDVWEGESQEEDMLDAPSDSELASWDLTGSPILTPALTDIDSDEMILDDHKAVGTDTDNIQNPGGYPSTVRDRDWVIARIEQMLEKIVDGLLDEDDQLSITLKSRSSITRRRPDAAESTRSLSPARTREITFPGNTVQEAWRFTVLVRILELVHSCLVDNLIMTKRDIYYRHPDLFVKQSVVDRYVDDLAYTFGISRSSLNVTAAAKGLVAGNFTIRRTNGTSLNGLSEKEGMLVPNIHTNDAFELSSLCWILVIEKEATFRSLLGSHQWKSFGSQGLMLTAKGYPDLASRKFLGHLADHSPCIPMFALVDFDPDGIAIMSTYKHGSYRLAHENVGSHNTPALNLPHLRWLGVQSHQIGRTPVTESDTENDTIVDAQGLMRLTLRDRMKARRMLEWDVCAENGPEPAWRRELQTMLMLNIKAEMQILDELPGGLVSWLSSKLAARQGSGVDVGSTVSQPASVRPR